MLLVLGFPFHFLLVFLFLLLLALMLRLLLRPLGCLATICVIRRVVECTRHNCVDNGPVAPAAVVYLKDAPLPQSTAQKSLHSVKDAFLVLHPKRAMVSKVE